MRPIRLSAALLALAPMALAVSALAQPGPEGGGGGQWAQMREQRRAEMAADVRVILRLRPDQETAYQSFLAAIRPAGGPIQGGGDPAQADAAYQTFSAVLTPDQQQVLQALRRLALERPHWGGRRHGGMSGEGGGDPQ